MTPASSKTMIIWLEDRVDGLEKRLKEVERLNKATQPDDDLNNVRYKANYRYANRRYETKQPLTDEQIKECSYDAEGFMISREAAMRNVEKAHGIGEKE